MNTNDPLSARATSTSDVNQIATWGVRYTGWTLANTGGRSPCSASANTDREPESSWPMLLPVIETTEPTLTSSPPNAPMMSADASAIGVLLAPTSGSRPAATVAASVITAATMRITATNANGTSRRGFDASPAGTPVTS